MRNPIRLKNLQMRFLPFALLGIVILTSVDAEPLPLWSGTALVIAGAALRFWGAGHLVKRRQLTLSGPYAFVRHPLYLGTLLVCLGFSMMVGGWLTLALASLYGAWFFLDYFPRKERIESGRLEALYGADFVRYRNQVPALLPRLSPYRPAESVNLRSGGGDVGWRAMRFVGNNELGTSLALLAGCVVVALRVTGAS